MTTTHPQTFGALLKRYRLASGLTQAELAERAGLSPEAVSALERGVNRAPRKDTVLLLADALGLGEQERALLENASRQHKIAAVSLSPSFPSAQHSSQPALVGRTREMALIQQVLRGTAPPVLFLTGEPGIGKTRLLREASREASNEGWAVLSGECQRQGGQVPYAPLLTTIERYILRQAPAQQQMDLAGCSWLVRLLPELMEMEIIQSPMGGLPPEQERRLMFAAVARFLANVAGPAGTLLILDDVHWVETDGCDLLATLVYTMTQRPLRVISAYRDTELPADGPLANLLGDLAHAGLATACNVPPLDGAESAELLQRLLADVEHVDQTLAAQVLRQAGGIPFYLVSWAQALRAGAVAQATDQKAPWDIVQSIRQRVAALPEIAREALSIAAVNGSLTPRTMFNSVLKQSGRTEDEAIGGLEAASQSKLLIEGSEDTYQIAELIRDVVAHDLSMARRATLHRRIAETLEQSQGETATEALAFHFAHSGESAKAVIYLEQAGDRAAAMQAQTTAESYYRELVERLDGLGRSEEAAHAREKLGFVLTTLGRYEQALTTFEQAAAFYRTTHDTAPRGRVELLIGQAHADQGTGHEGLLRLQSLLDTFANDSEMPTQTLAALYDMEAQLLHLAGEYGQQLEVAERAAAYARTADDKPLLCQIEMRRGNALRMLGRMEEASQVLEEAIQVAEAGHDERTLAYALDNASGVYLLQGEFDKTVAYVTRAFTLAERLGDPLMIALMVLRRGMNAYVLGEWQHAQRDFERAQEMTAQLGVSWISAYTSLGLGQLCLAQGEWDRAIGLLETSVKLAEHSGDLQALRWAQTALAEYDLMQLQHPEDARARLEPLLDRPGQQEGLVTYLLPYLAWAFLELNDIPLAQSYSTQGLERAAGERICLAWVDALRVSALLALREGRFAEATEALNRGIELSREMHYPYGEARTHYTFGLLYLEQQQPEQARRSLLAGQAVFNTLGERLYNEQIKQILATFG